jgi:hypothetical protein
VNLLFLEPSTVNLLFLVRSTLRFLALMLPINSGSSPEQIEKKRQNQEN